LSGNEDRELSRWSRLVRPRSALLAAAVGVLVGLSALSPALAHSNKGSSGSFKFSGEVTGTLKVPSTVEPGGLTACSISPTQGGTDVITWDKATLNVGSGPTKLTFVELQLQVSKFGKTYSMVPNSQTDTSLGAVFLSDNSSFQWVSATGTITTSKSGKSGSVSGTLSAGTYHTGTVTIKGSWAGCSKLKL
jgi:hypothetical protein